MYPGSLRCNNHSLPAQNFASTTPYSDYMGYHQVQNVDSRGQPAGSWGLHYSTPREEWNAYGPGPSSTATTTNLSSSSPGQISYTSGNYSTLNPAGLGALPPVDTINTEQISPHSPRHSSYEWMRKTVQSTSTGNGAKEMKQTSRRPFAGVPRMRLHLFRGLHEEGEGEPDLDAMLIYRVSCTN
uniref:Uncharacterized protein n=1 Tax=Sphaerodactylus townsendi TaxID=933632 RepID=A0ACB8FXZ8_9SAUR